MFFPTVFSNETNDRHLVKDEHICECGEKYNVFSTFTKNDLKKIKFKHYEEITCLKCKAMLNQYPFS